MSRTPTAVRIEQAIEQRAGLVLSVEEDGDVILVSGLVGSEADRQAALDIANEFVGDGLHVEESVEVTEEMPEMAGGHVLEVVDGDGVVGGRQRSSMDSIEVARSSDGTLGDEAIRDAVIRELREDAMTHAQEIEVSVEHGRVRLRGRVADLDDAEAAEEVAARVPGVVDVREDLELESLEERE
jgi:osmotically-inducible protein OsmY